MISKSKRLSRTPLPNTKAKVKRLALILLGLVAVVAGAFLLRGVIVARQNTAKQSVAQITDNSSDAKLPMAQSSGDGAVSPPINHAQAADANHPKAVVPQPLKNPERARASAIIKRQKSLPLQASKAATLKLMLKASHDRVASPKATARSSALSPRLDKAPLRESRAISLQPSGKTPATQAAQAPPSAEENDAEKPLSIESREPAEKRAEEAEETDKPRRELSKEAKPVARPADRLTPSKATASSSEPAKGAAQRETLGAGGKDADASASQQAQTISTEGVGKPQVAIMQGKSAVFDMRNLPQTPPEKRERPEREGPEITPRLFEPPVVGEKDAPPPSGAGLATTPSTATPSAPAPAPNITFDGLDFANWGAGHPPDTNGDVGPTYYIQTVNTSLGIYRKSDGFRVAASTFNTFMSQGNFGNLCDTDNFGDPVVLYDTFEDRWIITDFAFKLDGSGNISPQTVYQCFAASKTGDPVMGGWNYYSILVNGGIDDYPKFGIWPDGLYMSANVFGYASGASFQNPRAYAFNKAQMYAGSPTVQVVSFDAPATEFTLLPANARLQAGTPPAGSPNYFTELGNFLNAISVFKFHVDWDRISLSTFTGPTISIAPTSWAQLPTAAQQVPSQGGNNLDTLYARTMVQNQYTNLGGVESLWNSHTIGATTSQAAVRYYQLDVTGGTIAANTTQAATHSPDATIHRFMPSVAVDRAGNMAIGYSASSSTLFPAMRYAGRLSTDPVSTLPQTEQSLIEGTGTQTGSCGGTCTRWGDYSAMSLDPDGCTFWYTNMYYAVNGLNDLTRIGSFAFPSCTPVGNGGTVSGTVTATLGGAPISGATIAFRSRTTTTNGSGFYSFSNIPAGTYPSISASFPGYNSGTNTPVAVADAATTTKDFSLATAPTSACLTDTSLSDFQTGVQTSIDLTTSPGDATLLNAANVDQQNLSVTPNGFGVTSTSWAAQTFTPAVTGQITRADLDLFCSGCTGTTPNLTVSIRATTGATPLPTGADLATATITGFNSASGGYFPALFGSPITLTAGTRYALVVRAVSNPSAGTYAYVCSCSGSGFVNTNPYANGQRVTSANSGGTWTADTTVGGRDLGFITYLKTGFPALGTQVSALKDANPAVGFTAAWTTLSWNATVPANTSVQFQVAASNNASGPFNFVGPDGTAATFFTTSGASLSQFSGKRYLKYKAYLGTTDNTVTPSLQDVSVCFDSSGPTAAKLSSFTATPTNDGRVLIQWRTGTEVDNLGFNVYREVDGVRTRITPQLIAGSALLAGADVKLTSGNSYAWSDTPTPGQSVKYVLEDIDLNGKSTMSVPVALSAGSAAPTAQQATLLTSLGNRQTQLSLGLGSVPVERTAKIASIEASQLSPPFPLANGAAVKLAVNREGWYRITQPDLIAAGLDPKVDPRLLHLFVDGREVPITVQGEQDGKFDAADSLGFYGVGLDAASSDTRVYWLAAAAQPGQRIEKLQTKGLPTTALSFAYPIERKDRTIYFSGLRNGDTENFFGSVIAREPVDQSLTLQRINKAATVSAQLDVTLQGVTQQAHQVKVLLNGAEVGLINFSGQARSVVSLPIPHSRLIEGENVVRLTAQAGETDISLVDTVRLTYQHIYTAESNALRLPATAGQQITIDGFTGSDVQVFDVTNPDAPQEVVGVVKAQKGGYAVTATAPGAGQRTLLALTGTRAQSVLSARANQPSNWRQPSNGANLLIITHRDFAASTASLKALRQSQGLSVAVVDVEDIFDEFSYGQKTPQAIKDFLGYARDNWKKPPQSVLLVGDASLDPKNYLGFGDSDYVPTRLIDTQYMETASDVWLTDFDGNGIEDLAMGRLPVRTAQEAAAMINKIVAYDSAARSESVLLVADRNDGFNFAASNTLLRSLIPPGLKVEEIDRNGLDDATAKSQLLAAINRGQKIVNYAGHGSVDNWRGQVLTNNDALGLTNRSLSLFITMTCLNGYYQDPALESLAKSLMKSSRGGAVAVWSSSGMTTPGDQSVLNQQMYRLVFDTSQNLSLGEATQRAKATINDSDIRRTWILFGDPSMKLK